MATPTFAVRPANDNRQTLPVMRIVRPSSPAPVVTDDEDEGRRGWLWLLVAVSLGAHAALFLSLGHAHRRALVARRRPPAEVTVTVAPPPPAPAPPAAEPRAEGRSAVRRVLAHAVPPPPAKPAPPPPEAETPADFSGTTLTNDGAGPGWASATGNGQAMQGPIGAPGAKVTGRARDGVLGGEPRAAEAPVVALGSLSRPPQPPDLNGALERHYPEGARRQGTAGQAVLKARIAADGRVRDLVVVSQSGPGFGDACRATLRDSVWSAPLDREGRAVATFVTYTCRFEVR